jgi:hypothetical protein
MVDDDRGDRGETVTTRWARFARGWIAALFSTLVAAGSHTVAGGGSPSALALVVALAFAGVACVALTGTRVSLLRVTASVAVSQVAFHSFFSTIASVPGGSAVVRAHEHAHAATLDVARAGVGASHHTDGRMWLGHAVAGVLTIIALRYGEGAFWRLRSIALLFVRVVLAALPVLVPRPIPRPVAVEPRFVAPFCAFVRSSLGLRGPPMGAVA